MKEKKGSLQNTKIPSRLNKKKPFYSKWFFWMTIFTVIIAVTIVLGKDYILNKFDKQTEITNNVNGEHEYTFEDFKGTYAMFENEPYESPVSYLLYLDEDYYINLETKNHYAVHNVYNVQIDENYLSFHWYRSDEDRGVEGHYGDLQLELNQEGEQKTLKSIKDNIELYPVSEEQIQTNERFGKTPSMFANELKEHNKVLENYDEDEIDFARMIIMTDIPRIDPIEPIIFVKKYSAGEAIFDMEGSATYPENVIRLMAHNNSFSNHDVFSLAYSNQGNGYYKIYRFPTNYEMDIEAQSDEDYRVLAEQVINHAEIMYLEPSNSLDIIEFIENVEFIYE